MEKNVRNVCIVQTTYSSIKVNHGYTAPFFFSYLTGLNALCWSKNVHCAHHYIYICLRCKKQSVRHDSV